MKDNLVGYLLNSLDDEEHQAVEAYVTLDPEAKRDLELLRRGLTPLAADAGDIEPPPGLAVRTIAKVAEFAARVPDTQVSDTPVHQTQVHDLPRAPQTPGDGSEARSWWRRADFLVAAGICLVVAGLVSSSLYYVNQRSARVLCTNNLRDVHVALAAYHDLHQSFPDVTAFKPRDVAGMFIPFLIHSGFLSKDFNSRCPGNGPYKPSPWSFQELRDMSEERFLAAAPLLVTCYAYNLGYVDDDKQYHGPRQPDAGFKPFYALAADRGPMAGGAGNSINHGGQGQNVLFADGHVAFCANPFVGFNKDHIYQNNAGVVGAGLRRLDACLGSSSVKPVEEGK